MLNLSQLERESSNSISTKIKSSVNPDIYQAENVADFQNNKPSFHKLNRTYILFENIGLSVVGGDPEWCDWFNLHDDSGEELAYWNAWHYELFPTLKSFNELAEQEGFKGNDWVYEVLARYTPKFDLLNIVNTSKYKISNRESKKRSLAEMLKISLSLVLNPAFKNC